MKLQEWVATLSENGKLTIFGFADVGKNLARHLHEMQPDIAIDFGDNNSTRHLVC